MRGTGAGVAGVGRGRRVSAGGSVVAVQGSEEEGSERGSLRGGGKLIACATKSGEAGPD